MIALQNILVATDFGEPAAAALKYGQDFARCFGATLHVLTVCDNIFTRGFGTEAYVAVFPDVQAELEVAARKQLDAIVSDEDRRDLHARTVVVTSNNPSAAIVQYAAEQRIDLIIMGTTGRGAFEHLLIGSVAEKVVRAAPCPVLTVHHPEREFVVPDALVAFHHA